MVRESYSDPYVVIQSKAEVYEDLKTKKMFWDPKLKPYFQSPENPEYVDYAGGMRMEVWER